MTWLELAERCRNATGPDREIDAAIRDALLPKTNGGRLFRAKPYPLHFTSSYDAIIGLIERELKGWAWRMAKCCVSDDAALLPDFNCPVHGERLKREIGSFKQGSIWDQGIDVDQRPSGNVPLAMCLAFCTAMHEKATLLNKKPKTFNR